MYQHVLQTLFKVVSLQDCTTDTILHNAMAVERVQSLTAYKAICTVHKLDACHFTDLKVNYTVLNVLYVSVI